MNEKKITIELTESEARIVCEHILHPILDGSIVMPDESANISIMRKCFAIYNANNFDGGRYGSRLNKFYDSYYKKAFEEYEKTHNQ